MANKVRIKAGTRNFSLPDPTVFIAPGFRVTLPTGTTASPTQTTLLVTGPASVVFVGLVATTVYPGEIIEASKE